MNEYLKSHNIDRLEDIVGMKLYHFHPMYGILEYTIREVSFKTKWIIYDDLNTFSADKLGETIFLDYNEAMEYEFAELNGMTTAQSIGIISKKIKKHNKDIDTLYELLKKYPTEESRGYFYRNCKTCINRSDECIAGICRECMEDEMITGKHNGWKPDLNKLKKLWIKTEN